MSELCRYYSNKILDKTVELNTGFARSQALLYKFRELAITSPQEWILLCRLADTIRLGEGNKLQGYNNRIDKLYKRAREFRSNGYESRWKFISTSAAREVEKEIILMSAPGYTEGLGHDMEPAMKLLEKYEHYHIVFTQAERNLILNYAFYVGDDKCLDALTRRLAAHDFDAERISFVCSKIEEVHCDWSGISTMDGIKSYEVKKGRQFIDQFIIDWEGPELLGEASKLFFEDTDTRCSPFVFFPQDLPSEAVLLENGIILSPDDHCNWYCSQPQRLDNTYTLPHYYKHTENQMYEIADAEYQEMLMAQQYDEMKSNWQMPDTLC